MKLYLFVGGVTLDISEASYKAFKNLIQTLIESGYENYKIVRV